MRLRLPLCQMIFCFALATPVCGQVSEASLQALYGPPIKGTYTVRPGVEIATSNGPKSEVCVLTVTGPRTEKQLMAVIDVAVPASSRGLALEQWLGCLGACQSIKEYEKVNISSAVMSGQTANPAAIIIFKSKPCEERAKEARTHGFSISQAKQPKE